jgi:ABC-2 type transport system permease protein
VRSVLPATPFDAWHGLLLDPIRTGPVLQGALTSAVYAAGFLAAAWWVLRRRPFAGEGAPPLRASVPARLALAVAVVVALLAAAGHGGPTNLTPSRLERAITPTFERLAALQARWRTHAPASADGMVHVRTSCRRAGRAATGAGDDWACSVHLLRPRVETPVMLEVTLRPNGCYTADAPTSVIGPLLLRDETGRTFLNPLASFDGCFGTA